MEIIVKRIVAKIAECNRFEGVKLQQTGSICSQVGLPHETDYMLVLPLSYNTFIDSPLHGGVFSFELYQNHKRRG